jgi:hypothetical protein
MMEIDPRKREELAIRRYEASDRAGIHWSRRPEWLRQAFREAVERELRPQARSPSPFDPAAAGLISLRNR